MINESLLPKLKFIKQGHFSEDGEPALRLVGDLQVIQDHLIQPVKQEIHHEILDSSKIIQTFFNQKRISNPLEFIKAIGFSASAYLPIYYYISLTDKTIDQILDELSALNFRSFSLNKLIKRLAGASENMQTGSIKADNKTAKLRKDFYNQLRSQSIKAPIHEGHVGYLLESCTHLKRQDINWNYITALYGDLLNEGYSNLEPNTATKLRKAICHLDIEFFQAQVRNRQYNQSERRASN